MSAVLACSLACNPTAEPDPLDPEVIRELAATQGSATGDERSGAWTFAFEQRSCDCPSFEIDGALLDLCALLNLVSVEVELVEGSGWLGVSGPGFALLTGAIEADGGFVVGGREDLSNLGAGLEALRRLDGDFANHDGSAVGFAAQRLIGEVPGRAVDCRWRAEFVAERN